MNLTKQEWLEKAKKLKNDANKDMADREESFNRCDTDGALTQLVKQMSSHVNERNAEICKNFGKTRFVGLYNGDKRVMAKLITFYCNYSFQNKESWLLDDEEQIKYNRKFIPCNYLKKTSRIMKKLNLAEREEMDYGWVKMGNWNQYIQFRTKDQYGATAELVAT